MADIAHAAVPAPAAAIVVYSDDLVNNTDNGVGVNSHLMQTIEAISMPRDTTCNPPDEAEDHHDDDAYDQALLDDDVPSSVGTPMGITISAFDVITYIIETFITPYNILGGPFDIIKCMIHSLFFGRIQNKPQKLGFVGLTRAGPGLLSEYTATIYYAANDSFNNHTDIIKIMLYCMTHLFIPHVYNGITYAFKLDRGVKSGDTIKLILSVTFGAGDGANVILIPILNIVVFNLCFSYDHGVPNGNPTIENFMTLRYLGGTNFLNLYNGYSIFDLVARIRLYANTGAFGALIEPTDNEKLLMINFFGSIPRDGLLYFITFIKDAFYTDTRVPQDKNFAFFLNIFFNFYKISMNAANPMESRSTAKIMYTDFFNEYNNYGSVIRIFNRMMMFDLFRRYAIMFLSGSNAARVYALIQAMLNLPTGTTREQLEQLYDTHMASLSDNDFMFYLINDDSEQYRMTIRMMLGACLYYLKYILTPDEYRNFTELLEQSISIVGHDDHLLAQRLNANRTFLERCFNMTHLGEITITDFLLLCAFPGFDFYTLLSGNVTLAFLDVVFKHNTAYSWYISVFSIFEIVIDTANDAHVDALRFLTTEAMAVNCIATPWTLILNILYTIFVTENCIARIVVGKLGNDPKNLEKYFSILNTHLTYLGGQYTTLVNNPMVQEIQITGTLQDEIIRHSQACQQQVTVANPMSVPQRYSNLKIACQNWVQKMFTLALNPTTRELFFLNADYTFTTGREPTPLEKGICCAWSVTGNICNKDEFLATFNPAVITLADFQPVFTAGNPSERRMHEIVPALQGMIFTATTTASTFNVTPIPPLPGQLPAISHYVYMNYLWKHLTETSINLRSKFKSSVKDLTRIVGSKIFTATSLSGAYAIGLTFDELIESNNTTLTQVELNAIKNSADIIGCRRGLLPLLVPEDPNSTLFATMIVDLLFGDYTYSDNSPDIYTTSNILLFLGFLFSIKIKSNASIGPRNMLSLADSIGNFHDIPNRDLLLTYTPNQSSCSLTALMTNPDVEACAFGGVAHNGGGGKKLPSKKTLEPQPPQPPQPPQQPARKGVTKKEAEREKRAAEAEKERREREIKERGKQAAKAKIAEEERKKKEEKVKREAGLYQLLHPKSGPFKKFMDKIYQVTQQRQLFFEPKTCVSGIPRPEVYFIDRTYTDDPIYRNVRLLVGGGGNTRTNKTKSNNKISKTNNHTRRNKYKRNNKNKKHKSSPKYRKINPSSRSGSQSNKKKSKSKLPQKNVTFKRRRYNK